MDARTGAVLTRLHAHVPRSDGQDQAHPWDGAVYSPSEGALFFGDGTGSANGGFNPTSRDADVIVHEYTHAVIYRICRHLYGDGTDLGAALEEGYADGCRMIRRPTLRRRERRCWKRTRACTAALTRR